MTLTLLYNKTIKIYITISPIPIKTLLLKIWTCLAFLTFFVITTKELKPYVKPLCSENSGLEPSLSKWDNFCFLSWARQGQGNPAPLPGPKSPNSGFTPSSFYHLNENQKLIIVFFHFVSHFYLFWIGTGRENINTHRQSTKSLKLLAVVRRNGNSVFIYHLFRSLTFHLGFTTSWSVWGRVTLNANMP